MVLQQRFALVVKISTPSPVLFSFELFFLFKSTNFDPNASTSRLLPDYYWPFKEFAIHKVEFHMQHQIRKDSLLKNLS